MLTVFFSTVFFWFVAAQNQNSVLNILLKIREQRYTSDTKQWQQCQRCKTKNKMKKKNDKNLPKITFSAIEFGIEHKCIQTTNGYEKHRSAAPFCYVLLCSLFIVVDPDFRPTTADAAHIFVE